IRNCAQSAFIPLPAVPGNTHRVIHRQKSAPLCGFPTLAQGRLWRTRRAVYNSLRFSETSCVKDSLHQLVLHAITHLREQNILPAEADASFVIERTKSREHGDFATNAALLLAKHARTNPRALAQGLVAALPQNPQIAKVEIAGPGFINFFLAPAAYHAQVRQALESGASYGRNDSGIGKTAGVEFVSANPTGPLHVGHGRAAAIGDCIARVLDANGWNVVREFYYNDAGVQIENLALSTQARAKGIEPDGDGWPADGYRGDYIKDVARAYLDRESAFADGHEVVGAGDADDLDAVRRFAVAYLRHEQDVDLKAFGVYFDVYYLES